jgi:hypothetical protein
MTEGYSAQWQNDVQTGGASFEGAHGAAFAATTGSYGETTTYAAADGATAADDQSQGKADAAKEQASAVGQGAAQAGQQVASVAKDQAQNVVSEAGSQAKDLLDQARSELAEQAGAQQKRLTETLRSLGDELESMGQHSQEPGMATDLVKQASGRAHDAASWLESREPGSLLSELQSFARQRPAAFIALAAGAGLVAGRLGRGVKDATGDDSSASGSATATGTGAPSAYASSPSLDNELGGVNAGESRPFASSQDSAYQGVSSSEGGL